MVIDNRRFCDVCDESIEKGETFVVRTVPQKNALLFRSLVENMDDAPSFPVDGEGNVRLDICLDCKMNLGALSRIVN